MKDLHERSNVKLLGEELYKLHASFIILIILFQAVHTMYKPI